MDDSDIWFRHPKVSDGAGIWKCVKDSGALDLNSSYAYLLICRDFSNTSLVALQADGLVGFVAGYILPQRTDSIFIWQIGVSPTMRGRGIAKLLLNRLLKTEPCKHVSFLEATITRKNIPSRKLFESFAKDFHATVNIRTGFTESDFPADEPHEAEELFRIGPLHCPSSQEN